MKKIFVSLTLLLTAGLSAVFANTDPNPDQEVLNLFKEKFTASQNVTWSKQGDYDKATFLISGSWVTAYFNPDGQLEGYTRNLSYDQLPLAVMTAVDKRFEKSDVFTVREISNEEGTHYVLTLKAKNVVYKIKLDPSGSFNEVEKLTR